MIILVLINIIFIVCVYLKYYKFPKDIDVDNIENEEPIIIGYVNDLNFNNNFDLILAEIIQLNIKGYIRINYNKDSIQKYDYIVSQNVDIASAKLSKYELMTLNFLFSNKLELTKQELEEKLNNIYRLYNIQFNEVEKILNKKIIEENIIEEKKQKKLTKITKWCIKISILLVLIISILNAIGIVTFSRIYMLLYIFEKIVLCMLISRANAYTDKGKILKYNIEKYKMQLQDEEFLTEKNTMQDIVLNKEFADSIALHINTQAKEVFIDNKISKDTNKIYKKTIIIVLAIIISFFLAILIISRIMMALPKGVIIWIYIIMAISAACVADITLAYKKNKR